ncbi:MAG: hypothetical protein A2W00_15600, partial [Candidatus Eisenbacteria bacterium RBG_16_71_46]
MAESGRIAGSGRRGGSGPVARARVRGLVLLMVLALAAVPAARAAAPVLPAEVAAKLDPRLLDALRGLAPGPVTVWVAFADKGGRGPADLARRLAEAEAALAPRTRARRERAGVRPLVDERDLPVHAPYVEALKAQGLAPRHASRWFNQVSLTLDGARLAEVAGLPFVARVVPAERAMPMRDLPAGPEFTRAQKPSGAGMAEWPTATLVDYGQTQGQVSQIGAPALHDSGYVGTGVLVCILDNGFNFHEKQEALRNQIIAPGRTRDFVDGDTTVTDTLTSLPSPAFRHGTWVMGCIGGNLPGTYMGTAFGAEFALARTENDAGEAPVEMDNWAMGAEWADSLGADLITSSLGYSEFDGGVGSYTYADMDGHTTIVTRAAEIAASKGILVVNAVGNEGVKLWHYLIAPADVNGDSLIAVGAVDAGGTIASFSSYGPSADGRIKPDLVARGLSNPLVSTSGNPQGYTTGSGTSFATPLLAGLAACLIQARPTWTPQQVIEALRSTASRSGTPDN